MKVLIICSANSGKIMPFILEQGDELVRQGIEVDYFPIKGKGFKGYLSNLKALNEKINSSNFQLVHAHYGLSGALAVLQRKLPVVITFHNGETLTFKGNLISSIASLFSVFNIYVAQHIYDLTFFKRKKKSVVIPCGINLNQINVIPKEEAKKIMNLPDNQINILFGGSFANLRKNYPLAKAAIDLLPQKNINLIELKGFNREQVTNLLCGCDLMLLPTKSEGSPQIVKEAMACNCPIVATNVADISEIIAETEGCFLTDFEPQNVAEAISKALLFQGRTNGRDKMSRYDNKKIVNEIIKIYNNCVFNN
ncbi:MAG: putative teichuronic acid biosynthesis glycosyltransferase TuaC [Bacteroidetes bacterium ADurb.Bin234]|nr:MAG: putative teichuronic acid biosynthesis glycosyltransferase TuaC [Bacteroidetes bacterium ADurb.Bin234]